MKGRFFLDEATLTVSALRGLTICLIGAVLGILFNAASPEGIDLFGPVPHRDTAGIEELGLEEAWALYAEKRGLFVDARSAEEFGAGRIPGALLLPKEGFDEALSSWTTLIPFDTLLVTYCGGEGCDSSRDVAELLKAEGYSQVKVFHGGWEKWEEAGYPVEGDGRKGREARRDSPLQSNRLVGRPEGG